MSFAKKITIIIITGVVIGIIGAMLNVFVFDMHPAIIAGTTGGVAGGFSAVFMSYKSNGKREDK